MPPIAEQKASMCDFAIPSLENIVAVKIATILWNRNRIRARLSKTLVGNCGLSLKDWEREGIEHEVKCYVEQLFLPEQLKKKIQSFVKPTGNQIYDWMEHHVIRVATMVYSDIYVPSKLCWSVFGTINKQESAQVLVRDSTLCNYLRYELACMYCLEPDIIQLWNTIPNRKRKVSDCNLPRSSELVRYWNDVMKSGNVAETVRKMEPGLVKQIIANGNEAALSYFLHKATVEIKDELLDTFEYHIHYMSYSLTGDEFSECIFLLLEQMKMERLEHQLHNIAAVLFRCFLDWPLQGSFLLAVNYWMPILADFPLPYYDYVSSVLYKLIRKIEKYEDYNYRLLFFEFWKLIPFVDKTYSIANCIQNSEFLLHLFKIDEKRIVQTIWKDVTVDMQKRFISTYSDKYYKLLDKQRMGNPFFIRTEFLDLWPKLLAFLTEIA